MAATNDLNYQERDGKAYAFPALAGVKIYGRAAGGITANKEAVPAGHVSAVKLIGLAEERVDNTNGATGDQLVKFRKGTFLIPLAATPANIGAAVYASADDTFTLSSAGGVLQIGVVDAIDAAGTWLKI